VKTIAGLGDLRGKRVLVRSDLNVPLDGDKNITDDGRIRASVPTIKALTEAGARVVVCAHLGRPKGAPEEKYSLAPVVGRMSELLGQPVAFRPTPSASRPRPSSRVWVTATSPCWRTSASTRARRARTRGSAPRSPVSSPPSPTPTSPTVSVSCTASRRRSMTSCALLPSAMGGLVAAEVEVLKRLTEDPARPYAVVLGGAKVADKLAVIENLMKTADRLLIGGGMAFTFLAAEGYEVGSSLLDKDNIETCKGYLARAKESGVEIILPVDVVAATAFSADAEHDVVPADGIPADRMGLDIGPRSAELYASKVRDAKTVFWNGPMGAFEMAPYAAGTAAVAKALVEATADGALTVVGGGDSAAAVRQLGFTDDQFGHISTGGGASLEYLEGKELPGIAILNG
jgi:phosphoglycerate kinase